MRIDEKILRAKQARQLKKSRYRANTKWSRYPLLIFLVAVGTIVVAYQITKPALPETQEPLDNVRYGSALWPEGYTSVEELATSPEVDIIARGVVIDAEVYIERPAAEDAKSSWLVTKFSFQVHSMIKGPHQLKVLEIHQDGGTLDGQTEMVLEDPLMQVGDELILFLHEFDPDKYYVECGPQGRFVVQKGKVYAFGELSVSADERVNQATNEMTKPLHTGGINEVEFLQLVQAALSEK